MNNPMKKNALVLVILLVCSAFASFAQDCKVVSNGKDNIEIEFNCGRISHETVKVAEQGFFDVILIDGYAPSMMKGAPQLPVYSKMLRTPVCDSVFALVEDAEYVEFDLSEIGVLNQLYPSQGSVSKSEKNPRFQKNESIYAADEYFSLPLVTVAKAGIMRSRALANFSISPVSYNPVSGKLRVCKYAKITVKFSNVKTSENQDIKKFSNPMFGIGNSLILNNDQEQRAEFDESAISYLIVAHSMFRDNEQLDAFVNWKRRIGYKVELAFTDDSGVGTSANSIKSFISGKFQGADQNQPAPTFLLLVGDVEQIPAFNTTTGEDHVTDLFYAAVVGNDYLPDCYYGRLSAQNQQQLTAQLNKILTYEQYTMQDPSYLGNAVLIAGNDDYYGPKHANGQVNYIISNYINAQNPRYDNVYAHLHDCSSQAAQIISEVSSGCGWANYTAHGDWDSWSQPRFGVEHVATLQNFDKFGVMVGNCCLSGKFEKPACFGEALLRAENKGAVGYIGASDLSYWDEDFFWAVGVRNNINANPVYNSSNLGLYDKVFHSHGEDADDYATTLGALVFAGNMTVQSSASEIKDYYWEIYHCFGDPSLRPYMGIPSVQSVEGALAVVIGTTTHTLQTAPLAYVALLKDGQLFASAFANLEGTAVLDLSAVSEPGTYNLAVTAQNHIPFFSDFQIVSPNTPYIVATSFSEAPNTDFLSNDAVDVDLALSNAGYVGATNVKARITSSNPHITILNDELSVGSMASMQNYTKDAAFSFKMDPVFEDNDAIDFVLHLHWDNTDVQKNVKIYVKVPKMRVDDIATVVSNQEVYNLLPGQNADVVISGRNVGHKAVAHGFIDLTCNYSGVTVLSPSSEISDFQPNQSYQKSFGIKVSNDVPMRSSVPLYCHTVYGDVHKVDTFLLSVGQDVETFESGDFSSYNWSTSSGWFDMPWIVSSGQALAGDKCARSASGLSHYGRSRLAITLSISDDSKISYYRKVSSEQDYDKFYFYIDEQSKDEASGQLDWQYRVFDVPAGTHTFTFSYEKDGSQSWGSDCAWIDNVTLPTAMVLVVEDVEDNVGVGQFEGIRVNVFPNPTSEYVNIESETEVKRVEMFNIDGRLVRLENTDAQNHTVNINDLPSGMYILRVLFKDNGVKTYKIIKR